MSEGRPAISAETRRQVRQRSYFGCVVCGMPFYDYEHIEEYADTKTHEIDNLVLLCPIHHDMKTHKKTLSKERIKHFQQNPHNKNQQFSTKLDVQPTKNINCSVGSNSVHNLRFDAHNEHCVIWVNGTRFLTIHNEDGWLSLSLILTDTEGNILLKVDKGELVASTQQWDYEYTGNLITIRSGPGEILLKLKLSHDVVHVQKGAFLTTPGIGYIVDGIKLIAKDGSNEVTDIRCSAEDCIGGWAMLNRKSCLLTDPPGGFGFVSVF